MSEQHACCNLGLCQEAASEQTYYWSERGRPSFRFNLKPEYIFIGCDLPYWEVQHGSVRGIGSSPEKAFSDFDTNWHKDASKETEVKGE